MERVDDDGRWVSQDGAAWLLVEPSTEYLQQRQQAVEDNEAAEASRPLTTDEKLDLLLDALGGE